eukprot:334222-Amphidinium_carterae.1
MVGIVAACPQCKLIFTQIEADENLKNGCAKCQQAGHKGDQFISKGGTGWESLLEEAHNATWCHPAQQASS